MTAPLRERRCDNADDGAPSVERVTRYDTIELRKPVRMPDGSIRAEGYITRAGVFEYRQPDGSIRRELRHPDQVFRADTIESFTLIPLTLEHPPEDVTPQNVSKYQIGTIGQPQRHRDSAMAPIAILRHDGIEAFEKGVRELSCGYGVGILRKPGVHKDSAGNEWPYDVEQVDILGNHVALTRRGRLGTETGIRRDSAECLGPAPASPAASPPAPKETHTVKMKLANGTEIDVPDEIAKQIEASQKSQADALVAAKTEADAAKAVATAAAAQPPAAPPAQPPANGAPAEPARLDSATADVVRAQVRERTELIARINKPKEADRLSRLDSADLIREALKGEMPHLDTKDKNEAWLRTALEISSPRKDTNGQIGRLTQAGGNDKRADSDDDKSLEQRAEEARERMIKRDADRSKPKA